jgi:transcriptional regulator with XRE-family HTH domain
MPAGYTLPVANEIGRNLLALRRDRGWTQEYLAAQSGVKQTAISKYEKGRVKPDIDTLTKLATALTVGIDRIVAGVNEGYDLLRQLPGTSFASDDYTHGEGQIDAKTGTATTRVLREVTDAYETLVREVRTIASQFDAVRERIDRDPLGLETRKTQKGTTHRRRGR